MSDAKDLQVNQGRQYPANCDIYEENEKITMRLEMPGVEKDNLEITVDGDKLIIRAHKTPLDHTGKYLIREIRPGDYYQEFTMDNTIDRNKIEAAINNGVATLTLSLKESEKPRRIQVTAS